MEGGDQKPPDPSSPWSAGWRNLERGRCARQCVNVCVCVFSVSESELHNFSSLHHNVRGVVLNR